MRQYIRTIAVAMLPLLSALTGDSQSLSNGKPSFDVASIKPNNSGSLAIREVGGRFTATNITLNQLVVYAYFPRNKPFLESQLVGGPSWGSSDRFDIEAKLEGDGRSITNDQMQVMVQTLLEDRFRLRVHTETRESPIYELVVVKAGKMQPSAGDGPLPEWARTPPGPAMAAPPLVPGRTMISIDPSGATITGIKVSISNFVANLEGQLERHVVDKTGLKGLYDIHLPFNPDDLAAGVTAGPQSTRAELPSIFAALQDQLGLKLNPVKGSVDVVVIDSAVRPTPN
jgi:uncharacterized protein (TIGR03435 family)